MTEKKHKNVYAALLAAQPNFLKPKKSAENKHFGNKYADLEADLDAVVPALNAEGIFYQSKIVATELGHEVHTILHHPDSDTSDILVCPLLMGKNDMQGLKAARTYARRIGIEDICGIATGEDDDAETNRAANSMGAALQDAWRQSVEDNLPSNATPREKAEAYADAICQDFAGKGEKALTNRWNKHKSLIGQLETRFADLHEKVVDAYENEMMRATGTDVPQHPGGEAA